MPSVRIGPWGVALAILWLAAIIPALWAIETYKSTPGRSAPTPRIADAATDGRPRLLLFLHPRCPCSAATLAEFVEILADNPRAADFEVIFVRPEETAEGWEQTALWQSASRLSGVQVRSDRGELARQYDAKTSGQALLYAANGRLLFSGGITRSRGHVGQSDGRRAISAALCGLPADPPTTPVFGCPLATPRASSASLQNN